MAVITRIVTLSRAREREPLETWRVYGIETRMVGRAGDIASLHKALASASDEQRAVLVSVASSLGLGKSRLIAEFQRQIEEAYSETVFLQAACRDEVGGAYSMFGRLLKNRFYISDQEAPATARRQLEEAVEAIIGSQDAERVSHLVGHLVGLSFPNSPYVPNFRDTEGAFQLEERCFDAVEQLLRADARKNPLVIIFEDLQYATGQSLNLVAHLTRHLIGAPILFILSWNPDELITHQLVKELNVEIPIALRPLSDTEVCDFVRDTLRKAGEVPSALLEKIVASAHGNPLSVEEMLRILISEGVIDTRQQDWKIHTERVAEIALPSTVEETVQARLNALTDDERNVLEMAATVGTFFWPELVRCLYHLQIDQDQNNVRYWADVTIDERLAEILESLERKDMIRRQDDSWIRGFEELQFKHRIEREALYSHLNSARKQRYHRLIAQWVERNAGDGDDAHRAAEMIARHYDSARCLEQAARKYIDAADYARARYMNRKSVELYTKGLSYLSDADIALKLRAFHDLGGVHDLLGEYDQSLAYFREMLRFSWIINDSAKGGVAYNKIGRAYRSLGEYDEALDNFERALDLFRKDADIRGVASTLDDIGKIHWIRGQYDRALQFYSSGLQLRRETADARSIALSLNHLGSLKLQRGELRDAMVYFREALELRRSIDDRQGVADSFNNLGVLCLERGEVEQSTTLFKEALQMARNIGYRGLEGIVLNNLGEAYLMAGLADQAAEVLTQAMQVAEDSGEKRVLFDVLRNLSKLALKDSDRKLALERIGDALELARGLEAQVLIGIGTQSLADVHAHFIFDNELGQQSIALADNHYRDAIAILEEVGNESQLGRCLSSYGHFLVEQGQLVQGKKQLELAGEIFKRLEMRKLWDATERIIHEI